MFKMFLFIMINCQDGKNPSKIQSNASRGTLNLGKTLCLLFLSGPSPPALEQITRFPLPTPSRTWSPWELAKPEPPHVPARTPVHLILLVLYVATNSGLSGSRTEEHLSLCCSKLWRLEWPFWFCKLTTLNVLVRKFASIYKANGMVMNCLVPFTQLQQVPTFYHSCLMGTSIHAPLYPHLICWGKKLWPVFLAHPAPRLPLLTRPNTVWCLWHSPFCTKSILEMLPGRTTMFTSLTEW